MARTGGTVDRPARLYPPATGTCPFCGARDVPAVGGGRLTAHGTILGSRSADPAGPYLLRTCPGWGSIADDLTGRA